MNDEHINYTPKNTVDAVELRNRLRHIASLCWGLSIDIENSRLKFMPVPEDMISLEIANARLKNYIHYFESSVLNGAKFRPKSIKKIIKE